MAISFTDNRKKKSKKRFFISLIVSLVFVLVILPYFVVPLRPVARTVSKPIVWVGRGIGTFFGSIGSVWRSKHALILENQQLKDENLKKDLALAETQSLQNENTALKETLGRSPEKPPLFARVLEKPNRSLYDTLVIDGGSGIGIKKGQYVLAPNDTVIGEIYDVAEKSATVRLFSTSGIETAVRIEGQNIDVNAIGRGGSNFEISIPHEIVLTPGTRVLVPGFTDHLVAQVRETISDPREPFQKVLLVSPVNILELDFVFVER